MPARRLLMRKIREVLRLKYERGLSHRAIAQACAIGVGTVTLYLQRTTQLGLGWPLPAELDDTALEARLFRRPAPVRERVRPDCAYIHRELKRDGVTLHLLWEEYVQVHPDGYRYTQFSGRGPTTWWRRRSTPLNAAIRVLLDALNDRPMKKLGVSRRAFYEQLDRPALRPLPAARYVLAHWKPCRVNILCGLPPYVQCRPLCPSTCPAPTAHMPSGRRRG